MVISSLLAKRFFWKKADTSDEDAPGRPTIEEKDTFLAAAYEEVRAFPEFREGSFMQREMRRQRLRRAEREVREFPEFAETPVPQNARERRFARAAVGNRKIGEFRV